MTQSQYIKLGKAIKSCLQIGDKVLVIPRISDGDRMRGIKRSNKEMYVRELHNKTTAGLSRTKDSTVYGIIYQIIHPV